MLDASATYDAQNISHQKKAEVQTWNLTSEHDLLYMKILYVEKCWIYIYI